MMSETALTFSFIFLLGYLLMLVCDELALAKLCLYATVVTFALFLADKVGWMFTG